jgi:ABC-type multidrug transport system ATPase subunit
MLLIKQIMTVCLSANHVKKTYGNLVAVKDASLELHRGEIMALLGPNGAGKTTFIKILATLLVKDQGKVEILGHDRMRIERSATCSATWGRIRALRAARLTVVENLPSSAPGSMAKADRPTDREAGGNSVERTSTSYS